MAFLPRPGRPKTPHNHSLCRFVPGLQDWGSGTVWPRIPRSKEKDARCPIGVPSATLSGARGCDYAPYGLAGGQPGTLGRNTLRRAGGSTEVLRTAVHCTAHPGDDLTIETPGGRGFGIAKQAVGVPGRADARILCVARMSSKKPTVYLDTTILSSYWYEGADVLSIGRRITTRDWWGNERLRFSLWVSSVTEDELEAGNYPRQAEALAMARRLKILADARAGTRIRGTVNTAARGSGIQTGRCPANGDCYGTSHGLPAHLELCPPGQPGGTIAVGGRLSGSGSAGTMVGVP